MGKNKNIVLLLLFLLIILTFVFIVLGSKKSSASISHKESVVTEIRNNEKIPEVAYQAKLLQIDTVGECRQLSNDINSHKAKKIKELRDTFDENSDWDKFLIQGYSIEEIAYLIELIKPGKWAQRWVHDKRRAQSLVAKSKLENDEELLNAVKGVLSEEDVSLMLEAGIVLETRPGIPQENLSGLQEHSKDEQLNYVTSNQITINDVAYFIQLRSIDDAVIRVMIERLAAEKDKVYYDGIRSVNILDYALANGRPDIYELLFSKGYTPSDDAYLNNTLEWALVGISRALDGQEKPLVIKENVKLRKLVSIVKRLNTQGFTVDFKEYDGDFYARGYGGVWAINKSNANILSDYYGFDLRTLTQTPSVTTDSKKTLVNLYETEILSDYKDQSGILKFSEVSENCDEKLDEIKALKNGLIQNAQEEVKRVQGLYNNDPIAIEKHLATIEPSLVDAYRAMGPIRLSGRRSREFNFSNVSFGEKFFKTLHDGNYLKAIPLMKSASFVKSDHQVLFDYLCDNSHRMRWLDDFLNAGLKPGNFDACVRDFVKMPASVVMKLSNFNLNFKHENHFGKGLLFRAVSSKKVDLISVLISENIIDSYTNDGSMNALDNILSLIAFNYSGAEFLESDDYQILSLLLKKTTKIKESQKVRVSLIKRIHPDLYTELIDTFPSLEIDVTQIEPKYLFTYSGLLSRL